MKAKIVIVRTDRAGVFMGALDGKEGTDVVLNDARRLWYWTGAASLSELAQRGPSEPAKCKFPGPVARVHLFGVIEILDVTDAAQSAIDAVPVWSA